MKKLPSVQLKLNIKLYKLPEAWDGESEQVIFGFGFGSDSLGK